jgi:hypothetical protein
VYGVCQANIKNSLAGLAGIEGLLFLLSKVPRASAQTMSQVRWFFFE